MKEKIKKNKSLIQVIILIGVFLNYPIFIDAQIPAFVFGENAKEFVLNNERQLYCRPESNIYFLPGLEPHKPTEDTKAMVLYQIRNPAGTWFRVAIDKEPVTSCVSGPIKEKIGFKYWMKETSIPKNIRSQIIDIEQFSKDSLGLQSYRVDKYYIKENIKECPSDACAIEWMIGSGGIATVVEKEGSWFRIVVSNFDTSQVDLFGGEGWAHESLVPENVKAHFDSQQQNQGKTTNESTSTLTQEEESKGKPIAFLPFFNNKDLQTGLPILLIVLIVIIGLFLFKKRIKITLKPKEKDIILESKRISVNWKGIIIALLLAIGIIGIAFGAVACQKTLGLTKVAGELSKEEKYDEAIGELELAQGNWITKMGFKKQDIINEIEKNKKLLEDKSEYNQGLTVFNKENWAEAKELLSKVSEMSPHYQDAKDKTEKAQDNITKKQISEAVEKATQEAKRIVAETQRKVEAETVRSQEKTEELEQEIKKLQENQIQDASGYKASEIIEGLGSFIVSVSCIDGLGNWSLGSGVIYNLGDREQTIVLTNHHVVKDADLTLEHPCFIAYSLDPTKGFADFYFADPVYFPTVVSEVDMQLIDFYFLSLESKFRLTENGKVEIVPNVSLRVGDYVPVVCQSNETKVGEEIIVLGYPTIGGQYLTATEGIISGYDGEYYLTTSAKIEHGSSGGGAFLKSTGCLVGMSTFARLGEIESFARLINIPILNQYYLSKIWK